MTSSGPICHSGKQKASAFCFPGARSASLEVGRPTPSLESPRHVRLSPIRSALPSHLAGHGIGGSTVASSSSTVASKRAVCRPSGPSQSRTSRASESLEPPSAASRQEVPPRPQDPLTSRVGLIQRLIRTAGFSMKIACVAAADLKRSTSAIYQSKWTRFLGWCDRRGIDPCKTTSPVITELFLYLHQELELSVTAVKGYRAALNHVFSLTGMDLAASSMVSRMFLHFERSCPPREIRPPDWNLSLVLRCLSRPSFEHLKLAFLLFFFFFFFFF